MMIMRWQLAYPLEAIPVIGTWLSQSMVDANGVLIGDGYNALGAMHGTIMVFLGVVPLAVGGFGNFVLPLQVGAPDMAFPKLNMASYWVYFLGGITMLIGFFVPGGAANSGWTSYTPLANIATTGQTVWLFGMVLLITSSVAGVRELHCHDGSASGEGFVFLPTAVLCLGPVRDLVSTAACVPAFGAAGVLQLMDRLADTSFFMPTGLWSVESCRTASNSGGAVLSLAAPVLVPGPPGGLRVDPPGDGNPWRGHRM